MMAGTMTDRKLTTTFKLPEQNIFLAQVIGYYYELIDEDYLEEEMEEDKPTIN